MVTFEELTKGSRLRGISPAGPVVVIEAPAEKPPVFGDALRRLSDRATYLYRDGARYWYGLKATVSRLAADRANPHFGDDDVDEEIAKRLDAWRSAAGSVAKVHTRPRSSSDVSGEDATRLVVLGPAGPSARPEAGSEQGACIRRAKSSEPSGGARRYRNMLVLCAPDRLRLGNLHGSVRPWLVWRSISEDREALGLEAFQLRQVDEKVRAAEETVAPRLTRTYQWVLNPTQGITKATIRTRTQNASTLKFDSSEFDR